MSNEPWISSCLLRIFTANICVNNYIEALLQCHCNASNQNKFKTSHREKGTTQNLLNSLTRLHCTKNFLSCHQVIDIIFSVPQKKTQNIFPDTQEFLLDTFFCFLSKYKFQFESIFSIHFFPSIHVFSILSYFSILKRGKKLFIVIEIDLYSFFLFHFLLLVVEKK